MHLEMRTLSSRLRDGADGSMAGQHLFLDALLMSDLRSFAIVLVNPYSAKFENSHKISVT